MQPIELYYYIITGPPNGPVLFSPLASVVCRRRLLLSSVTLPAVRPADRWAHGRSGDRHSTAGQHGYVPLGRHLVFMCTRRRHLTVYYCLSNAFDRLSNHFGLSVCVCVCPQIGCQTITSAVLYRFSPNFACRSEIWLFRRLLFPGQTGSRLLILEVCKIRFWQFRDCGGHIFPRIVTKTLTEI